MLMLLVLSDADKPLTLPLAGEQLNETGVGPMQRGVCTSIVETDAATGDEAGCEDLVEPQPDEAAAAEAQGVLATAIQESEAQDGLELMAREVCGCGTTGGILALYCCRR